MRVYICLLPTRGPLWRIATAQCWIQARSYRKPTAGGTSSGSQWTLSKLKANEKYPLTEQLSKQPEAAFDPLQTTAKNIYVRTQIVSPDLCDDVLKYIGPSLEKHKGCDILDLHPGVGLWSQKIHEFLQPRTHVLVEPAADKFAAYLRPLLDKPGSKYKLVTGNVAEFSTVEKLTRDGTFPQQETEASVRPDRPQPKNSFLITGSLVWDPKLPGYAFDSMAKQLLLRWLNTSLANQGIHSFDPTRLLLWMDHEDFKGLLPRSLFHAGKSSLIMDALSNITEVVTPGHMPRLSGKTTVGREPQYELESIIRAMRAGREKGMELSAHRRESVHDFADDIARMTGGTGVMKYAEMTEYLRQQEMLGKSTSGLNTEQLIKMYKIDAILKEDPNHFKIKVGNKVKKAVTQEGKQAAILRATTNQVQRVKMQVEAVVDIGEDIYHLECKILGMDDGADKAAALKKLQALEDAFTSGAERVRANYRTSIYAAIDDRIALHSGVPRLQWDTRPYEPLVMQPEEVWPPKRLSLIDCEPRSIVEGRMPNWFEWWQDFLTGLFQHGGTPSIVSALENLQPGASALIEQAPSLKDPAKGGRLNMQNLRVRMLTVEMVDELRAAYSEWPFRSPNAGHSKYFQVWTGQAH